VLLASQNVSSPGEVWTETALSAPVSLAAGSTYVVGVYFTNGAAYAVDSGSEEFPDGTIGAYSLWSSIESFPTYTNTYYWPLVGLRYAVGAVALTPTNAGPFANGVWSGDVAVLQAASNVVLKANDGAGHTGLSNPFNVLPGLGTGIVLNGGFELGSFTDWNQSGNLADTFVTTNSMYVQSGNFGAQLGPSGSLGYLTQTLTTVPGENYLLSFWFNSQGGDPNQFLVTWNGTMLYDQTNIGVTGWTNMLFHVQALGSNTVLQFGFRNDPSYFGLDGISVVPSPIFQQVIFTGSAFSFTLEVQPGSQYQVQYSTNLASTNWFNLGTVINASSGTINVSDSATNSERFYRVILLP
jgi:hypothetical protein